MPELISAVNSFLWSGPLLFLLMGTHLFFTFYLVFPQKNILKSFRFSLKKEKSDKNLSPQSVLWTTLAVTLGTGNIIGISTAIALGGPGALFWCILTGVFGMASSFAECFLCYLYREKDDRGIYHGGPMYVYKKALNKPFLATFFCILVLVVSLTIGCTTQASSIADTAMETWHFPRLFCGILISLISSFIILGGIKSISRFCEKMVPFMFILYCLSCIVILIINRNYFFPAVKCIIANAFGFKSMVCGVIPSSLLLAARYGVARGLFTNEAGLGTSPIAACGGEESNPLIQSLVSMSAVFWDTVVMCSITGLVIISNLLAHPETIINCPSSQLTAAAFRILPYGEHILSICLILFAFTTLVAWTYYGEQAIFFLSPKRMEVWLFIYRLIYILLLFFGSNLPVLFVFELTDLLNALMLLFNVTLLYLLRNKIKTKLLHI